MPTNKEYIAMLEDLMLIKDDMLRKKQALIDSVMTPEIISKIDDIEVEFANTSKEVDKKIANLEEKLRQSVVKTGESVRGHFLNAILVKPRVSYDIVKLAMLEEIFPQIKSCKKVGDPSVQLRRF